MRPRAGSTSVFCRAMRAFVVKDAKIEVSYLFAFLLHLLGIFFAAASSYFIARLVGRGAEGCLAPYGGNYFSFVLIGTAFGGYLMVSLHSLSNIIRDGQVTGTLEAILTTPVNPFTFLLASSAWNYVMATVQAVIYILFGLFVFDLHLQVGHVPTVLTVLVLSILSFLPFGILSAGFVLVFKRGDPVAFAVGMVSNLLGGVLFPVAILPPVLRHIADWIPLTHALHAMRLCLLMDAGWRDVGPDLLFLAVFSCVAIPASMWLFRMALRLAMKNGTLTHY
ncbi:MAG: ABC transporter permease [Spartobacteria bacterium]|nr:ABC transporter permease [Spartobacteria bacterium]